MSDSVELSRLFDACRSHLRAVAFRMLGGTAETDDALQEAWLRASRVDVTSVVHGTAWLTTIVGRVCLDMPRSRRRRREELGSTDELVHTDADGADPEARAILADSVGLALLVVLDRLTPAERVAFILHDMFGMAFEEIGEIVERTPIAAKKLASRARARVAGAPILTPDDRTRHLAVVEAFLVASRARDLDGLLAVLAPDVVRRADRVALRKPGQPEVRGSGAVATETLSNAGPARFARAALVNGRIGVVVAPRGRLVFVLDLAIEADRITTIEVIGEPTRLRELRLGVVDSRL